MGILRKLPITACLLSAVLISGCTARTAPPVPSSSSLVSSEAAESVSAVSSEVPAPTYTLTDLLLGGDSADLGNFTYYGPATIFYESGTGFTMPDPVFSVYKEELLETISIALSSYGLEEDSRQEITFEDCKSIGDFVSFSLNTVRDGKSYSVTLCRNGSVLIFSPEKGLYERFEADDSSRYPAILETLSQAKKATETLPYQAELGAPLMPVATASEVVNLYVVNNSQTLSVTCSDLLLEREVSGGWEEMAHEPYDPITLEPGEFKNLYLNLTSYENGQAPGRYRARIVFERGEDRYEAYSEYEIAQEGDIYYPAPPEMTAENKAYAEKYLKNWGSIGDIMLLNFSENKMSAILEGKLYLTFSNIYDGEELPHDESGSVLAPADVVEDSMTRRFPLTAEQVRKMVPASGDSDQDHYDAEKNIYVFHTGYGGGGSAPVVTDSTLEGDLLTLECSWFSSTGDNAPSGKNRLTIRVKGDGDFMYLSNEVLSSVD